MIYGDHDAALVDTFMTIEENKRLVEWIRSHGRNLTHIFLTHGHGDHVYGIGQVLEAFPDAKAGDEYRIGFFGRLFPGQIPQQLRIPTEISSETIALEDHHSIRVTPTRRRRASCGARASG